MDIMLGSRRRTRATVCRTVAEYTERCGWTVVAGSPARGPGPRGRACPCDRPYCTAPGLHPLPGSPADPADAPLELPAGTPADEVERRWQQTPPDAGVLLPTGRAFDVLDVPEAAGHQAVLRLERMGTRLGPVLSVPRRPSRPGCRHPQRRALFLVAPGAAAELPELLYKMGWDDAGLDLRGHGPGGYLPAPPTVLGPLGPARWLRAPLGGRVPEARLVLGTLAYACHRTREPAAATAGWLAS